MKLAPMTQTGGLAMARGGSRWDWVRVVALSLVVIGSFLLQGCFAGAWVAAVAVDTVRRSNIIFGPFEQSWVAPQQEQSSNGTRNSLVTSVAVLPVEGDPEMGARLATLLQQETTLRVETPATVAAEISSTDSDSRKTDDADRSALAKEVTRDLGVDTVLLSRVTSSPAHPTHPSDWGRKSESSRRLYLYLVNRDGHLLWKDELPFTQVQDSTASQEASIQVDLSHHVMKHVKKLQLAELGYLPK